MNEQGVNYSCFIGISHENLDNSIDVSKFTKFDPLEPPFGVSTIKFPLEPASLPPDFNEIIPPSAALFESPAFIITFPGVPVLAAPTLKIKSPLLPPEAAPELMVKLPDFPAELIPLKTATLPLPPSAPPAIS